MKAERFNTFIDAIFAIIVTIMVLDLKAPTTPDVEGLVSLIEPFLAYLITFIIFWVSWYTNHELMKSVSKISYKMYWITGLWILSISLLPIATSWVGENLMELVPNLFYTVIELFSFFIYHVLMEPEALKQTPSSKRPVIRNSLPLEVIRVIIIIINLTVIWFWPPIALVTMLIFSGLHVSENLHLWKIKQ